MPADASVLVAYATRHGSTRGVAERIAWSLRVTGHDVDLREVGAAHDIAAYCAVIFGSPVYNQHWLPEAETFLHEEREALAGRPVWLFSVGTFGDRKRVIGRLMPREPHGIDETRKALQPRGYRVFAGVIDRHQWPGLSRLLFHLLGGRLGDNRDWQAIEAWARQIADELKLAPRHQIRDTA